MVAKTVKLPADAHTKLVALAAAEQVSMGELLADLIERRRRQAFLEGANEDLARLQAEDPAGWADYLAESRSLEGTMMDGLEDDPWVE